MVIVKLLLFAFNAVALCAVLYCLFWVGVWMLWCLNVVKKHIVWLWADDVCHITLFPPQKRYRREIMETGFSVQPGNYRSAPMYHYRYRTVYDGTYRKMIVTFANRFRMKIYVKEESPLYERLLAG